MIRLELDGWVSWMRTANRSAGTIRLRTYHVGRVLREIDVDPWQVTSQQIIDYLAAQNWGPETRRSVRAALRAFYGWAMATGRCAQSPAELLPIITLPRAVPRPTPEHIYRQALLEADDRVQLMIRLAAHHGLRAGEISRVRREDITPDLLGWSLRVLGKGGHVRDVPLHDDLARELLAHGPGWIFPSIASAGGPLTPGHVTRLVSRALPDNWTCHTLRHRCGTVAYWNTKDLRAVQELLGHAKVETTVRYTKIRPDSIRAAMMAAAATPPAA
jgi:integrase